MSFFHCHTCGRYIDFCKCPGVGPIDPDAKTEIDQEDDTREVVHRVL